MVYEKGQSCYEELVGYFGKVILDSDGNIDRAVLFNEAFPYPEKYRMLNRIAFRHILLYTEKWLNDNKEKGYDVSVIDAPMLFESGFDKLCDKTVAVIADRETQISRVMRRDGISSSKAESRLEKQHANEYYISQCDYFIDNSHVNGEKVGEKVTELVKFLRKDAAEKG